MSYTKHERITIHRDDSELNYRIEDTRSGRVICHVQWLNFNRLSPFAFGDSPAALEISSGYDNPKIAVETTDDYEGKVASGAFIHLPQSEN